MKEKIVPMPQTARWWKAGLALAAAVALFAGLTQWRAHETEKVSYAAVAPRAIELLSTPPDLAKLSSDKTELRTWLVAQGAPADFQIPDKLMPLPSVGCKVMDVQGRPAWLTCFWREQGELVHLFAVRRSDFRDGPDSATPQMSERDGWSFASWTKGDVIYTMAAPAPMEKLRPLVTKVVKVAPLVADIRRAAPINS